MLMSTKLADSVLVVEITVVSSSRWSSSLRVIAVTAAVVIVEGEV